MEVLAGIMTGFVLWFFVRYGVGGFYTIDPSERAVITTFGRAQRLGTFAADDALLAAGMRPDERERYSYPQVRVVGPGFYWRRSTPKPRCNLSWRWRTSSTRSRSRAAARCAPTCATRASAFSTK